MDSLTRIKLGFLLAGLLLIGYGIRAEVPMFRWAGIGVLAAALVLRFVPRARR